VATQVWMSGDAFDPQTTNNGAILMSAS
jgi:hypothetical protein